MAVILEDNKPMTESELKAKGWRVYSVSGTWIGRHDDGRKFKAGTFYALMQKLSYEENP